MIQITQMLTILGEHLPIVLVGGAEALAAIVLIGRTRIKNESMGKKKRRKEDNPEQILLDTLNQRKQEVCILVRRRDMMPVYVAGNLEVMTGISVSVFRMILLYYIRSTEKSPHLFYTEEIQKLLAFLGISMSLGWKTAEVD